ncbi:MAG: ABC transporter permease, partial [Waddliaceae bacterium]
MKFVEKNQIFIVPFLAFLCIFGCWEVFSRIYKDLLFVLPSPSNILFCIWERKDRFLFHTLVTLNEMAGGFLVAFLLAFPLAWIMTLWTASRIVLQPIFVVIQCIPMFTLAPIMILWFDWSYTAIVIPMALMIFFPLTMNIYQGLRSTPKHLVDYFRINEATTWQLFVKLQLPWALPNIFSGIRISTAIAGIGAVAGEWAGAQAGLGLLMLESRRAADLEVTFGALFCLTFLSMFLYIIMILLEKRVITRRPAGFRYGQIATTASIILLGVFLF